MNKKSCAGLWFFYDDKLKKQIEEENSPIGIIKNCLLDIIAEQRGISEENFNKLDEIKSEIEDVIDRVRDIAEKMDGKRPEYCAEVLYDELFSNINKSEDPCGCTECEIKLDVVSKSDKNWYKTAKSNK